MQYDVGWTCPPDAEAITLSAYQYPDSEAVASTLFGCDDAPEPITYDAGSYAIIAQPEGAIGDFYAIGRLLRGEDGDVVSDTIEFPDSGAFFAMRWTIDGGDRAVRCAEVGAIAI